MAFLSTDGSPGFVFFEHLGKLTVPKDCYGDKRLRKKFHYWLQGRIQRFTKYKAHAKGIRFGRVLARGTSEYAYDGSGKVPRIGNRQMAVFSMKKIYNDDLSASYTIAAIYWIREHAGNEKSLDRKVKSPSKTKVLRGR
ncbi:MAG: hypothetical protein ABSA46_12855 [Thermodesulfovibrionales bacterium]